MQAYPKFRLILVIASIGAVVLALYKVTGSRADNEISASIELAEAMGGDTTGFDRADQVRDLVFPDDFGPHSGFRTEWWYYTGNLDTEEGRPFGYELTLFRIALTPPDSAAGISPSAWTTNQLFMGHFSLADVEAERFFAYERFSRAAVGLAGAQASPYRIWLEDWSIEGKNAGLFPTRIRAEEEGVSIDLSLEEGKSIVLQGNRGLDRKGADPGNASYYYSFTRLPTTGTIRVDDRAYSVNGSSWKDHEWSTSALGPREVGWDWFALQLSDGRDIMYYMLRESDGTPSPYTKGVLVQSDGTSNPLLRADVEVVAVDSWTSPHSTAMYPSGWRMRIPSEELDLTITPLLVDQELNVSVRYWEGAVAIDGTAGEASVTGRGYVELTGYAPSVSTATTDSTSK